METPTIKKIKDILPVIDENLISFRRYFKEQNTDLEAALYGNEAEYSVNGIVAGVKNVLSDMHFLVKAHNLFINLSILNERNLIFRELSNLNSYLSSNNIGYVTRSLDQLKTILRTYNLRIDHQRYLEFNTAIDELCHKAVLLGDEIESVKQKLQESETVYTQIEGEKNEFKKVLSELVELKDSFSEEFDSFRNGTSDFRNLASSAQINSEAISNNLTEINNAKKTFDEFIGKINEREIQLETQRKNTDKYNENLIEFTKSYEEKLSEVQNLIDKSKQALQFTTADGMSAAFASQYKEANKWSHNAGWLLGASLFVGATLLIGIWIVTGYGIEHKEDTMWFSLIGRLSMIPFTIYAAIFCSQQYIKQKNLVEDYAYKSVLSKSIVAFSEELRKNDPEKYTEYLSTVLKEIHQDPLRKRGTDKDSDSEYKESTDVLSKLIDLAQTIIKTRNE